MIRPEQTVNPLTPDNWPTKPATNVDSYTIEPPLIV